MFRPVTAIPFPAGLSDRLALLIRRLCGAIGDYGLKHRSALPVLDLAAIRLFRLSAQFAALAAKLRDGRLPARRTARRRADPAPARALPPASDAEASSAVPGPPVPELPRLPRDFGWLLRLTPGDHFVRGYRLYIEQWLADPELAALLEAAPKQAGRILRPLCRILGIPLPPQLRLPPRGKRPSPAAPSVPEGRPRDAAEASPRTPGPSARHYPWHAFPELARVSDEELARRIAELRAQLALIPDPDEPQPA